MAVTIADGAVGMAALIALLDEKTDWPEGTNVDEIAAWIIACASKVRFQPSTRQLVMTFDLAMTAASD